MRQVGSVDSYSQCKILASPSVFLSRSWASSDQTTFSQSSAGHFWWACAHCSLTFVFAADRRGAQHGLLPLNTIFILRYFSAHQSLSAFCQLQLVIKGQHLTKKKKRSKTHASKSWEIGSFRETQTIWHYQHRQWQLISSRSGVWDN